MTTTASAPTDVVAAGARRRNEVGRTLIALGAWIALILVAAKWGDHVVTVGDRLRINAPPLTGAYRTRAGTVLLVPIAVAAIIAWYGPRLSRTLRWELLVGVAMAGAIVWAIALGLNDGWRGLTDPLLRNQYIRTVPKVGNPFTFLSTFTERLPSYNIHTKGHPPGMVLVLWSLDRMGLGGLGANLALVLAGGAASVAAVMVAAREVAGEAAARAAAPFLVLAPAAIWWSSGDAFFAGVSAWAITLVVLATGTEGRGADRLALAGGLLFGATAMLSYGLVLLAVLPVVIAVARRRFRPLVVASLGAGLIFVAFLAAGFWWLAGLAGTRTQYWAGVASRRPYSYFVVGNLGAFALAVGTRGRSRSGPTPRSTGLAARRRRAPGRRAGGPQRHVERRGRAHLAPVRPVGAARHRCHRHDTDADGLDPHLVVHPGRDRDRRPSSSTVAVVTDTVPYVLVVEDDATVSEVVVRYLEREGLTVQTASDGASALASAEVRWPDLVVLDLMLPGIDGIEVCRRLRAEAPVPVIMLTARGDEDDRVVGLDLGADDYITKPFSPRELTARVKAVLRRAAGTVTTPDLPGRIEAGDLVIEVAAHEVRRGGNPIPLTAASSTCSSSSPRVPAARFGARSCSSTSGATPTATAPR